MAVKDFIYNRLQKVASDFPEVTIRYAFDQVADIHIVELTPQSEYYGNQRLNDVWVDFSMDMIREYPNDMLTIVSDDSTLKIDFPEFEFNPKRVIQVAPTYLLLHELFASSASISFSRSFYTHGVQLCSTRFNNISGWNFRDSIKTLVAPQSFYSKEIVVNDNFSCEDSCAIAA